MKEFTILSNFLHELNAEKKAEYKIVNQFTNDLDDDKHTIYTKEFDTFNVLVIKIKIGYGDNWCYDRDLTETIIEFKYAEDKYNFIRKSIEYYQY